MKVLMESITTISAMVALLAVHIGGFGHEFVWFGERYSFKKNEHVHIYWKWEILTMFFDGFCKIMNALQTIQT